MLRSILAVIAGYAVMAVVVMAGFAVAFVAPDIAFQPSSLNVTYGWLIYALLVGLVGAAVGGFVCAAIARSLRPVVALAIIVIVLGLVEAIRNSGREQPKFSAEEIAQMSAFDKASHGVQPTAYAFALPALGAVGVLIGGRLKRRG